MLDIIAKHRPESAPPMEQILNYVNKEVTQACDKEKCLSDLEASIISIKSSLDYILHIARNHPMHPINRVDDSIFYTLDEAVALLKIDRQKVIKMVKSKVIPGVKHGRVYLPYKWAVDNFIFSSNGSISPDINVTPSGLTPPPSTRSQRSVTFTIDRYIR